MNLLSLLGKRKAFYFLPLVEEQQYCEHTTLVMWWLVYTVHSELTPFTSCVCLCPVSKHAICKRKPDILLRQLEIGMPEGQVSLSGLDMAKLKLAPFLFSLAQSFLPTHEANWNWLVLQKKKKKSFLLWQKLLALLYVLWDSICWIYCLLSRLTSLLGSGSSVAGAACAPSKKFLRDPTAPGGSKQDKKQLLHIKWPFLHGGTEGCSLPHPIFVVKNYTTASPLLNKNLEISTSLRCWDPSVSSPGRHLAPGGLPPSVLSKNCAVSWG